MARYRVQGPDGAIHVFEGPDDATPEQVTAFAQQQFASGGQAGAAPATVAVDPGRQQLLASAPMRLAKGGKDPIDGAAQLLQRALPDGVVNAVNKAADAIGGEGTFLGDVLGVKGMSRQQLDADIRNSNAEYEAARSAQGQQGEDVVRMAGNVLSPLNSAVGRLVPMPGVGAGVRELAAKGAAAGATGGLTQPVMDTSVGYWGQKAAQAAAGAATGAVLTPAITKGAEAVARGFQRAARGSPDPMRVNVATNNIFVSQGLDPKSVPAALQDSVQRQVSEALAQGNKIDPAGIVRRAQFEAVGLTGDAAPTAGQLSRDPMQWANEKNLSGVRLQTPQGEGNPLAQRFQNQNDRLQEVFNLAGAGQATDRVTAGQQLIGALKSSDAPVKAGVDNAYEAARAMTGGRAAELDRATFSRTANDALDQGMWGHFVPPEIRNMLNDVTSGKTPFTVETAQQMDSILSAAQRRAGHGSPQASAIGVIRNALHDAPFVPPRSPAFDAGAAGAAAARDAARTVDEGVQDVTPRMVTPTGLPGQRALAAPTSTAVAPDVRVSVEPPQPGTSLGPVLPRTPPPMDEGAAARAAFDQARAAARQRFATIEATPALKAALDGEAPDKFVQNYIINADVRDLHAMKKVLANSPEALAQARAQLAEHLKNAAFGPNVSGDKAFAADRYANVMRSIGPEKLKVFFSPEELVRLNLAGKVASDINSKPAGATYAVNSSGTGAALMNLLSKIAGSPLLRNLPGGRAIANQVGEIQTERAINQALTPPATKQPTQLSPETMRAIQLLFAPAGVTSGVLGGLAVR